MKWSLGWTDHSVFFLFSSLIFAYGLRLLGKGKNARSMELSEKKTFWKKNWTSEEWPGKISPFQKGSFYGLFLRFTWFKRWAKRRWKLKEKTRKCACVAACQTVNQFVLPLLLIAIAADAAPCQPRGSFECKVISPTTSCYGMWHKHPSDPIQLWKDLLIGLFSYQRGVQVQVTGYSLCCFSTN